MADITYYASINDPSYNFIDGNGNATTAVSTTTSTVSVSLKNNDVLYVTNNSIRCDTSSSSMTFLRLAPGKSVDEEVNSLRVQNDTMTILMAVPPDCSMSYETHNYKTIVNKPFSPARRFSRDSNGDNLYLLAYRNTFTKSTVNISSAYDNVSIIDSNGSLLTTTQLTKILSSSEVSSYTFNDASSYSIVTSATITRESSDQYVSKTYVDKTWYGTLTGTSAVFVSNVTYRAQDDGLYTIHNVNFTPRHANAGAVGILNRNITSQSDWATHNTAVYYTSTMTMKGVVADRDGNVYYGDIYGKGNQLHPDHNYSTLGVPSIITSVANKVKVGTVDTSWFSTLSTRSSSSNEASTRETYIEFNNHGIDDPVNGEGGSFFMSTYTWVSLSKYSTATYSTRTSSVNIYVVDNYEYVTTSTLGVDAAISFKEYGTIYDNKCSFSSSVKTSTFRNTYTYSGKTSTSQSFNSISSSSEIDKTVAAIVSSYTGSMYASAYNDGVSVTNTASTTYTATMSSTSSVAYSNMSTESCEVTSYINMNGYSYYTSFTGELAGQDSYGYQYLYTSWVQSAINESSTYEYRDALSQSIVKIVYKTFGDPINSTTVSQESLLSSTVYRYTSKTSGSTITYVSSYANSSVNMPEEYFSTYCSTYKDITSSWTYEGPDKDNGDYYNFNVKVTSIGTSSDTEYVDSSSTSSSRLNIIDYGGTTYRLSDLISSKSWINVGNTNFTENYLYDYSVSSMFSFNDTYIQSLSTYTTRLATSYTQSLDTRQDYNSYSATKSTSLVGISTGDRFIDRVEISRTYTSSYSVSNTVVYYNGSTLDTISSRAELYDTSSEQDIATVSRTFISSPSDLTTSSLVINSTTETTGRGSFVYSSRELVASTSEQQNDTLVFASTFNTYSFYNSSYTTSTLNTVENTLSATTYEDWYNPVSWTETALSIATSTGVTETVVTNSGVVSVTQSVTYTPVYSTVDGVYVTA